MKVISLIGTFLLLTIMSSNKIDAVTHASSINTIRSNGEVINNETLSFNKSVESGYVTEISYKDNSIEVYNIEELDRFISNVKNGKKDKIRVVMYAADNNKTWVNKLKNLEYDGKKIIYEEYDTYTDPNKFLSYGTYKFKSIEKKEYGDSLWYGLYEKAEGGDGATLISFLKKSAVN